MKSRAFISAKSNAFSKDSPFSKSHSSSKAASRNGNRSFFDAPFSSASQKDSCDNFSEINEKYYYKDWKAWRESPKLLDSSFNPLVFGICIAMDIGVAMRHHIKTLKDPVERDRIKREFLRDLRIIRRPFYYAREKARRRELAAERRKIIRRSTTAPMPTPAEILTAWEKRKDSQEAMILLGGIMHDLECYVDNCLKFDDSGAVVGRNGGIRGWLKENLPELAPKYKTLMRYKALAMRLRQATDTKDPTPTSSLLDEPREKIVTALLTETKPFFSHVFKYLEHELSADTVFLDKPREAKSPQSRKRRKLTRKREKSE